MTMVTLVPDYCNCTWTICQCDPKPWIIHRHRDYPTCDSTDNYPIVSEEDKASRRKSARKSFSRFVNPEPKKNVDHYSHAAQRR